MTHRLIAAIQVGPERYGLYSGDQGTSWFGPPGKVLDILHLAHADYDVNGRRERDGYQPWDTVDRAKYCAEIMGGVVILAPKRPPLPEMDKAPRFPEEKGGPGSGNWAHAGRPGLRGGSAPGGGRGKGKGPRYTPAVSYSQVAPAKLRAGLLAMPADKQPFLTMYTVKEYNDMGARCFVSETENSGYALKPDGDIISVFSMPGAHEGKAAMGSAIANGGKKLDCFDGFLAQTFYPNLGFKAYERWTWDPQYAPEGWDQEKYDSPDVVLMSLEVLN